MRQISDDQVLSRLTVENPWWETGLVQETFTRLTPRRYLSLFQPLVTDLSVHRAILLMGPRRVGKTVLLHHVIASLLEKGTEPDRVAYISVDHPLYNGLSLERLVQLALAATQQKPGTPMYIVFDEIQYLQEWEVHLKVLVDNNPHLRFVASGSAAAALRLKSQESGAGRFTDFLLPPLTFHEYLALLDAEDDLFRFRKGQTENILIPVPTDPEQLNRTFIDYLNFGGYPELALSDTMRKDPGRFVKSDIIDKVLLRDLPSLYGIQNIPELNSLFTTLAYNTANEVSLGELSQGSGVAKPTLTKYIEYLEAAFLIRTVNRVDENAKRFKRRRTFKVYLTNPSMRGALFAPIDDDDPAFGALAETGVFSQWFHSDQNLYYARWSAGEIDIIHLAADQQPSFAIDVKWSDRHVDRPGELHEKVRFCERTGLDTLAVTSRTARKATTAGREGAVKIEIFPAAEYAYVVGRNLVEGKRFKTGTEVGVGYDVAHAEDVIVPDDRPLPVDSDLPVDG